MNKIKLKLTHGGKVTRENKYDSGFDVYCRGYRCVNNEELSKEYWFDEIRDKRVGLAPNETIMLLTGIQMQLPIPQEITEDGVTIGYKVLECQVRGRSGLSLKKNTNVKLGTIDSQYLGMCGIIFHNNSERTLIINENDKIAQLVFNEVYVPTDEGVEYIDEFETETTRGESGFGSSGNK